VKHSKKSKLHLRKSEKLGEDWIQFRLISLPVSCITHSNGSYVHSTVCHCDSWRIKDQLDVTCCLFYFLYTQHVSNINISIIRSLRLCRWITTLVVLFSFRCVFEIWCSWVWVVSVLQACTLQIARCKLHVTPLETNDLVWCIPWM